MIFAEHQRGNSQQGIGRPVDRPSSAICRDPSRGRRDNGRFYPQASRRTYDEPQTHFSALCKMKGNGAVAELDSFSRQKKRLTAVPCKSIAYDRGPEMACHPEHARRLKIDIWLCDPRAPWQRSSNENTNGMLGQLMSHGKDLGDISRTWLNAAAVLMENRPEKISVGEPRRGNSPRGFCL